VDISIGDCLGKGWAAFKRHPGTVLGGFFLYGIISLVGGNIPFLNILFTIFLAAPLAGGMAIFSLRLAKDASPAVGDIFDGFDKYWKFMGAYWLLALAGLLCAIPAIVSVVIAAVAERELGSAAVAVIAITGVAASVVIAVVVMLRWVLVYLLLADEDNLGVLDAFKKSSDLTSGWRGQLFLTLLVLGLFAFCGLLLLILGIFITGPVVAIGWAWLYMESKRQVMASRGSLAPQPVTSPPPPIG